LISIWRGTKLVHFNKNWK